MPRPAAANGPSGHRDGAGRRNNNAQNAPRRSRGPVYAALDLGTNNCRLLIARPHDKSFRVLDGFTRIVRLGEGLSVTGRLSDAAMERTIDALRQCRNKLNEHQPARMRLIATEACRLAENAPEFLGIGLSTSDLVALNAAHPNVSVVKAESTALVAAGVIEELRGRMRVFNGRAGFELLDNLRAGVDGMIPGTETIDLQVGVERAMRAGNESLADELYRKLLPLVAFMMQGLSTFLLYGKLIAAERLGIDPSHDRIPHETATPTGLAWARRYAAELGPLPA